MVDNASLLSFTINACYKIDAHRAQAPCAPRASTESGCQGASHPITTLVLHYTEKDFITSVELLTGQRPEHVVSVHYLVDTNTDYRTNADCIYQLVDESYVAWHAGSGAWRGDDNINQSSIGIEIVNFDGNQYPYPDAQIAAVIWLLQDLVTRYQIAPQNVIAHSDMAPSRKRDPGVYFPWQRLHQNGIGAWPDIDCVERYKRLSIPTVDSICQAFATYGYQCADTAELSSVVKAFQRHFRPDSVDGALDRETYAILRALLFKYYALV